MVNPNKVPDDIRDSYDITNTVNDWLEKDPNLKSNTNRNEIIDK